MKKQPLKKLNSTLTNWVISLHQIGCTNDFLPLNRREIQCMRTGESFAIKELQINLIDCNYDRLTRMSVYPHHRYRGRLSRAVNDQWDLSVS